MNQPNMYLNKLITLKSMCHIYIINKKKKKNPTLVDVAKDGNVDLILLLILFNDLLLWYLILGIYYS